SRLFLDGHASFSHVHCENGFRPGHSFDKSARLKSS
ncbi:dynein heavy chain, partial [Nannochloropsis gaditana CCMP526]